MLAGLVLAVIVFRIGIGWHVGEISTGQMLVAGLVLALASARVNMWAGVAVGGCFVLARQSGAVDVAPVDVGPEHLAAVGVGLAVIVTAFKYPALIVPAVIVGGVWLTADGLSVLGGLVPA